VSAACRVLAPIRCELVAADAEDLTARGDHATALAVFEQLAFDPPRGCTATRELGLRAAREAAAAGELEHARALVQRTYAEHGYPVILRGSPYGHGRQRLRPPPDAGRR